MKHGDKFTGINFGPLNMDLFQDRGTGMWANMETGVIAITEAVVSVGRGGVLPFCPLPSSTRKSAGKDNARALVFAEAAEEGVGSPLILPLVASL